MNSDDQLKKLESELFYCEDLLRGVIPTGEHQTYATPLIFFKIVSDTVENPNHVLGDNQHRSTLARIEIPEDCSWETLEHQDSNLDSFIDETFQKFSQANDTILMNVFNVDYVSSPLGDDVLSDLIRHLSDLNLSLHIHPDLGEIFTTFVFQLGTRDHRRGADIYTPKEISQLMVRLLGPLDCGDSIHDPTCGVGGLLLNAAHHVREHGGDLSEVRLTGQELNLQACAIGKMNLLVNVIDAEIRCGNSLTNPKFVRNQKLEKFDFAVAHFPFSARWARDELKNDEWSRFTLANKLPRADRADFAFIMHLISHLTKSGKGAVLVPQSLLFRKFDNDYRRAFVEEDLLEAIVALPDSLLYNTSIPTAILLLNKNKTVREKQVQFINGSSENFYEQLAGNQNRLTEEGIQEIVANHLNWNQQNGVSRLVSVGKIRENRYDLNIGNYLEGVEKQKSIFERKRLDNLTNVGFDGTVNLDPDSPFDEILGKLIQLVENSVIVLGSYQGANENELVRVKEQLSDMGYDAHLFKDLPEFPDQNLSESVATAMRIAGFCVMIDREPSGHIDEYRIAQKQGTVLARLVPESGGSTRMIGGTELVDINFIKSFEFDFDPQERLPEAVEWAEEFLAERRSAYDQHYEWR